LDLDDLIFVCELDEDEHIVGETHAEHVGAYDEGDKGSGEGELDTSKVEDGGVRDGVACRGFLKLPL
jgi:hypothetical protein